MTYNNVESDTIDIAEEIYQLIVSATANPTEAATILNYLHVKLWIQCRADPSEATLSRMLEAYCDSVRHNVLFNSAGDTVQ